MLLVMTLAQSDVDMCRGSLDVSCAILVAFGDVTVDDGCGNNLCVPPGTQNNVSVCFSYCPTCSQYAAQLVLLAQDLNITLGQIVTGDTLTCRSSTSASTSLILTDPSGVASASLQQALQSALQAGSLQAVSGQSSPISCSTGVPNRGLSTGGIVGISVGGFVLLVLIILGIAAIIVVVKRQTAEGAAIATR